MTHGGVTNIGGTDNARRQHIPRKIRHDSGADVRREKCLKTLLVLRMTVYGSPFALGRDANHRRRLFFAESRSTILCGIIPFEEFELSDNYCRPQSRQLGM